MYNIYEGMDMKGTVLRLEKSSIFDGDGLRTVVFLKGCSPQMPLVFHTGEFPETDSDNS